ncbi:MAG: acetylornithine/succinylornithine family transaminase [Clostridia bacterium]|nr:acetylornithine/succinylornithine family transaminase [Clostridia bacterium]
MDIKELDKKYVAGTYNRFPVEIVSGKGSVVCDVNGREYIDMGSGIGVTSFGIADEEWVKAVTAQLAAVQHTSNLYYTEPCARLAEILCSRTGMKKVFFSNSGAEANECAIKAARKYAAEKKGSEYYKIVTLENSFHGRTLTTLAATGQDKFHTLFNPLTPGFLHIPANDTDILRAMLDKEKIAGVMIECIQGEGGVNPLDAAFVKEIETCCREKDIIFIVDEVQTGNGRSGRLYSYMNFGVAPDVVSTAKGLGGGLPLGATLLGEKVESILGFGDHGSTFGGNPVSCAGAINVISRINEGLLAEIREKSKYIMDELSGCPGIESVTGMGLMIGIKTQKPAAEVVRECMEHNVLCLTAKDKVRLLPALNIPMELVAKAVSVIREAAGK